jgi:N-acetyl-gamma-glutamyl-phosphate reductase
MTQVRVAVVGASGYTGAELLRLLGGHPGLTVSVVTSEKSAGAPLSAIYPHLASLGSLRLEALDPDGIAKRVDAAFLALPHTKSMGPAAAFVAAGRRVVDLSADFRLKDPAAYQRWYATPHAASHLLKEAVYGLPELRRAEIRTARLVASPGCYPTAALLQLAPLAAEGLIESGSIVIDAKSGISGAGRSPALPYHFPEAHEAIEAYKIGSHRHIPEIEQELTGLQTRMGPVTVTFTPHLVPMNRGILSTAYCRLRTPMTTEALRVRYQDFYKAEPFVRLLESTQAVNPGHVRGSNFCHLGVTADTRTGWVVTLAALDNLVKGAAGQAIQAMNLMLGLPEEQGLAAPGLFP